MRCVWIFCECLKACRPSRNYTWQKLHTYQIIFIIFFLVSHETCLLDQVLELIMNEKPPTSASLFLNEDTENPPLPDRVDLRRRLRRAMERRASSMKERMSSVSKASVKGFLKRNLFVLFTIAAVALGEWKGTTNGGFFFRLCFYICAFRCLFIS